MPKPGVRSEFPIKGWINIYVNPIELMSEQHGWSVAFDEAKQTKKFLKPPCTERHRPPPLAEGPWAVDATSHLRLATLRLGLL